MSPLAHSDERAVKLIGKHPCYDPNKDIVIPTFTFHKDAPAVRRASLGDAPPPRDVFFAFAGNDGTGRNCKTAARCYSRGVRQRVTRLFAKTPGFALQRSNGQSYSGLLSRSQFCFVASGDGFATRMEDSVRQIATGGIFTHTFYPRHW